MYSDCCVQAAAVARKAKCKLMELASGKVEPGPPPKKTKVEGMCEWPGAQA
jgi:hypothetical protein